MNKPMRDIRALDILKRQIKILEQFEPKVREALRRGEDTHSFDDVCRDVLSGELTLLHNDTAALFVEVHKHPRYNTLHVFLAVGDLHGVLELERILPDLAKARDCKSISMMGRKGWKRQLTQLGWREILICMVKDANHEQKRR